MEADDPPLRLLLGKDAVAVAAQTADRPAAQDAQWRQVSESASVRPPASGPASGGGA
ncbi:hypothetical protein GCM10010129_67380 [Streptomyces fumigatiscleroticus]|nr:hypothetical protein GCM10010129_67380 [Streptomyces fumigatiscleroticus]